MAQIRPFRGVRARTELAQQVIAPPYDVLNEEEARAIVARNPQSFLRVTRPEVNFPSGVDGHAPEVYVEARRQLEAFIAEGVLVQDPRPSFYIYSQKMGDHLQHALMAVCSVEEYDRNEIRKHEFTRPDKEQDRVDHVAATDAQTGLVFLTYRQNDVVEPLMAQARQAPVLWTAVTDDEVTHTLRLVDDPALVDALQAAFAQVPNLYIADGHHRSAAASRVNAARGGAGSSGWFLAGLFPHTELQVLSYNRLVADLNGHSPEALLAAIGERFTISPAPRPAPERSGQVTMYLGGQWRLLTPKPGVVNEADPVARLDVSILQDLVLGPLLGIRDPRRDTRIQFVGGIRGHQALSAAVDSGQAAVAFHLYPTGLEQLFAVADAGEVMPPKSTWFEPKLRGGVLVHRIAE
ncbi:DUF1015 family protein [Myxococcota bacterium]|nr:DUF1015 family protein [Myxococcota bacterium]